MPKDKKPTLNKDEILFKMNRELGQIGANMRGQKEGQKKLEKSIQKLHEKVDKQGITLAQVKARQEACSYNQQGVMPPPAAPAESQSAFPHIVSAMLSNKAKLSGVGIGGALLLLLLSLI